MIRQGGLGERKPGIAASARSPLRYSLCYYGRMSIETDIQRCKEEEERIRFASFDHELSYRIGIALHEEAQTRGASVTIDIRAYGQQLFHLAMGGTAPDNDRWIERKIAVVNRFGKSSFLVGRELAREELTIGERYFVSPLEFSPHGGCFPVRLRSGGIIGTVTVSGLTQQEDHALVAAVLEKFVTS